MKKEFIVYTLSPSTDATQVRYVGYVQQLNTISSFRHKALKFWFASVIDAGIGVILTPVQTGLTKEEALALKQRLIQEYTNAGFNLININLNKSVLAKQPRKQRPKGIHARNYGWHHSEETKAKMRKKRTAEQRKRISDGHKGLKRVFTPEHLANMKAARLADWKKRKTNNHETK